MNAISTPLTATQAVSDASEPGVALGLVVVDAAALSIRRRRAGKGFVYLDGAGRRITDAAVVARIRSLAIPPAYTDVRIAAEAGAHLQAVGQDEAGRIQYRYHPAWTEVREVRKAERLAAILGVMPRIRAVVARDLAAPRLERRKALAAAVALLDRGQLRVGCECYAHTRGGRGTATLLKRDAKLGRDRVALDFLGKGGKRIEATIEDPRLARALGRMAELAGRRLIQYVGPSGKPRPVTARDVNAYLHEISGGLASAKDLRMLGANAIACALLAGVDPAPSVTARKRQLTETMRTVAQRLCNTPTVVRKSYVHAGLVAAFEDGRLAAAMHGARARDGLSRIEAALRRIFPRNGQAD